MKAAGFVDGKFVKKVECHQPGQNSNSVRNMDWIKLNTQVKVHSPIITQNYYALLTSRVDMLKKVNIIIHVRPVPHRQQQQSSLRNGSTRIRTTKHRV